MSLLRWPELHRRNISTSSLLGVYYLVSAHCMQAVRDFGRMNCPGLQAGVAGTRSAALAKVRKRAFLGFSRNALDPQNNTARFLDSAKAARSSAKIPRLKPGAIHERIGR